RSFRTALDSAALLLPVAIVAQVLTLAFAWLLQGQNPLIFMTGETERRGIDAVLLGLPANAVRAVATGAMVWIAYAALTKKPISLDDALEALTRSAVPVVLVQLVIGALFAAGDLIGQTAVATPSTAPFFGALAVLFYPLGIVLGIRWWAAIPVAI